MQILKKAGLTEDVKFYESTCSAGGLVKLDKYRSKREVHNSDPLKVQEKETSPIRHIKVKPLEEGMQVSHHMDFYVSEKDNICRPQERPGRDISRFGSVKECKVVEGHLCRIMFIF